MLPVANRLWLNLVVSVMDLPSTFTLMWNLHGRADWDTFIRFLVKYDSEAQS